MGHHFIVGFDVEPDEPMKGREAVQSMMRARVFVGVDRKLLAKGQLDDRLFTPTPEQRRNRCEDDRYLYEEGPNHRTILLEPRSSLNLGSGPSYDHRSRTRAWESARAFAFWSADELGEPKCLSSNIQERRSLNLD